MELIHENPGLNMIKPPWTIAVNFFFLNGCGLSLAFEGRNSVRSAGMQPRAINSKLGLFKIGRDCNLEQRRIILNILKSWLWDLPVRLLWWKVSGSWKSVQTISMCLLNVSLIAMWRYSDGNIIVIIE